MNVKRLALLTSALSALAATPAQAQDETDTSTPAETAPVDSREIIVTGRLVFRNRTTDPNPVLSYDLEYFQRFEPVSVGEMLKRVPGVTFTSDVLEYDGVQMRGLPPGFTSVLINGRRPPGAEADGSFFVDRIPAELVERIEIIRSPRADQPSDGIAGVLNVITKEGASFNGGSLRAGALINEDGGVRPSAAAAYAGTIGQTNFWLGLNYQQRRNPKDKVSLRFGDIVGDNAGIADPEFDNTELQQDTRDGTDISGNFEITTPIGDGRLRLNGLFVDTDRDEDELSVTFEGADLDFDGVEIQQERISQQTYSLGADLRLPIGFAELGLAAGWSAFRENTNITVLEGDNPDDFDDVEVDEEDTRDIDDDEFTGTASLLFGRSSPFEVKLGVDLLHKERDGLNDGTFISGAFDIEEDRYDPYARATWQPSSAFTLDAGLRYEITRRDVNDGAATASYNEETLNPSLNLRYAPSAFDQFRLSVARTVRRPDYDLISPVEENESPGDGDITIGNPDLRNQMAWGVDLGYERRLPGNGIFGVNLFYRDISDLIELVNTGQPVIDEGDPDDPDDDEQIGSIYEPRNIGDGEVWGIEFDLSTPLGFIGLPDTGFFANYTYLDSSTRDPFTGGERRFNDQPRHVYNVGFIQTLRSLNASFGASVSGRSTSVASNFDEIVRLRYNPDLEAFVEYRFNRNFLIRLSGQNLLNRTKREFFTKFDGDNLRDILDAREAGDVDEYEIERERSGRLFQATLRAAF